MQQINRLAEQIEEEVLQLPGQEVESRTIGALTVNHLRSLDKVAYIRFASVYHEFQEVGQFIEEIQEILQRVEDAKGQRILFEENQKD